MGKPYLLVTDTHLGLYGAADVWHDVTLRLFKTVADYCSRHNIDTIIHLGDFFNNRKNINVKSLDYADAIGNILNDFKTILVVGNHDTYYKNQIKPHSLVVFNKFENIMIIDEPTNLDGNIGLVPWGLDFSMLETPYLMGHFEVNGFRMNSGYSMMGGKLNVSDFKNYDKVISGHYHTPMYDENVNYLGSPFQQNFADVGSKRGFYVFDDGELDFIEFLEAPRFVKINTSKFEEHFSRVPGNIVKLIFDEDYGTVENTKILEKIQLTGPFQLHPDFSNISGDLEETESIEDVDMKDNKEIVDEYVKTIEIPRNLEPNVVVRMFSNLIDSVTEK